MKKRDLDYRLSPRATQAVRALLSEPSIQAAADKTGIGERTLRRWLKSKPFKSLVNDLQREALDHTIRRLEIVSGEATEKLVSLMRSGDPGMEYKAARALLENSLRVVEAAEIERRLAALEGER